MDTERIKRRVRALLNLAAGDGAAEGEIDNAMRMAAALMDEHHLSTADVQAEAQKTAPESIPTMGTADSQCVGVNLSTWEIALDSAICLLVGTVQSYQTRKETQTGTFGRPKIGKALRFYGPAEDAALAAELMGEWAHVIATMAVGKYGGCFRGDGAMYALGFARQLRARAQEAANARKLVITDSTRALVLVGGAGSLAQVLDRKRELAKSWLRNEKGVKLSSGSRRSGYRSGSHDAHAAGRADGARADFSARRMAKLY